MTAISTCVRQHWVDISISRDAPAANKRAGLLCGRRRAPPGGTSTGEIGTTYQPVTSQPTSHAHTVHRPAAAEAHERVRRAKRAPAKRAGAKPAKPARAERQALLVHARHALRLLIRHRRLLLRLLLLRRVRIRLRLRRATLRLHVHRRLQHTTPLPHFDFQTLKRVSSMSSSGVEE